VKILGVLVAMVCVWTGGAGAQTADPAPWQGEFAACIAGRSGPDFLACVGRAADPCQDAPGGSTTVGMTACFAMEADLWDAELNRIWPALRKAAKAQDAVEADVMGGAFANFDDALLQAQRAWIAFRDAECALDYAQWGAGSMRSIAGAACRMDMTAERVARLSELAEFRH